MIIEFDGIFIESKESLVQGVLGCRIYTNYQPCIALFSCTLENYFKLSAMADALRNSDGEFYANRFTAADLIRFLDDALGITVLQKEDD